MRYLRNTLWIGIVTALTALAVYAGVQIAAGASTIASPGASTASVAPAGQTYMCPQTGCTSSTCHAVTGSTTGQATASNSSGGSAGGGSGVMTCPRTGCTASTCHGATGSPPPNDGSGGSSGPGNRGYRRQNTGPNYQQSSGDIVYE
jgi:hypothetical protein